MTKKLIQDKQKQNKLPLFSSGETVPFFSSGETVPVFFRNKDKILFTCSYLTQDIIYLRWEYVFEDQYAPFVSDPVGEKTFSPEFPTS